MRYPHLPCGRRPHERVHIEFYENVYGVDRATAESLRSAQWMDWCVMECPTCG